MSMMSFSTTALLASGGLVMLIGAHEIQAGRSPSALRKLYGVSGVPVAPYFKLWGREQLT